MRIKTKIITSTAVLIVALVGILSVTITVMSEKIFKSLSESQMATINEQSAQIVNSRIQNEKDIIELLASNDQIRDQSKSNEEKFNILNEYIEKYDYVKMGLTDLDGNIAYSNGTAANISDREYFKKAKKGETAISDPLISSTEHILVVVAMAPIKVDDTIVGFLSATMKGDSISSISEDIKFGDTGRIFMIKNDGTKIAHYNSDLVINADNDIKNAEKDSSLKKLADLETKMINGESGNGEYEYEGQQKYMSYALVPGTSWSLAAVIDKDEVLSNLTKLQSNIFITAIIFLVLSLFIVYNFATRIGKNIKHAIDYIIPISEGDFSKEIDEKHLSVKDETGEMIQAISKMKVSIKGILNNVITNFNEIQSASEELSQNSVEMDSSIDSVSCAIKEVTLGAASQSDNLSNITAILGKFSDNLNTVTDSLRDIEGSSKEVIKVTDIAEEQFKILSSIIKSMNKQFKDLREKINHSSENIEKINSITAIINSIAEQTNFLALNAAIEASRAGESGRGFAVVAEDIRKLSEQSQSSVKNISKLINTVSQENALMIDTTEEVDNNFNKQTSSVKEAIDSFKDVSHMLEEVTPKIDKTFKAILDINDEKDSILEKVESITAVSEETSAAAEEVESSSTEIKYSSGVVADAAKDLEDKSNNMINEVNKFKF